MMASPKLSQTVFVCAVDEFEAVFLHHLIAEVEEAVDRDVVHLLIAADVDGDGVLRCLVVAENEDVGVFVLFKSLDLGFHVVVGVVRLDAKSVLAAEVSNLLRICVVLGTDRDDRDLVSATFFAYALCSGRIGTIATW